MHLILYQVEMQHEGRNGRFDEKDAKEDERGVELQTGGG